MACMSLLFSGCENVDVTLATQAGIDAVRSLAVEAAQFSDSQNKIATSESKYSQRLKKLTEQHIKQDGFVFNFKVYIELLR